MRNYLLVTACAFALPAAAFAAGRGTSAAAFLKLDTSARAAGMGGAFTAVADDAGAPSYNPAGITEPQRKELLFSHDQWLQGVRHEYASYVHPLGETMAMGFNANYLYSKPAPKTDENGNEIGQFSANDGAFGFSLAARFGKRLSAGATAKLVRQSLDDKSARAYAADFGLLYSRSNFRFGASLSNIGTKVKLYKEAFPLPLAVRLGASCYAADTALITADAIKYRDYDLDLRVGAEKRLLYGKRTGLALRAGYRFRRDEGTGPGFTGGVGVEVYDFNLDYAFMPFGELGNSHKISVSVKFGYAPDAENPRRQAAGDILRGESARGGVTTDTGRQHRAQDTLLPPSMK